MGVLIVLGGVSCPVAFCCCCCFCCWLGCGFVGVNAECMAAVGGTTCTDAEECPLSISGRYGNDAAVRAIVCPPTPPAAPDRTPAPPAAPIAAAKATPPLGSNEGTIGSGGGPTIPSSALLSPPSSSSDSLSSAHAFSQSSSSLFCIFLRSWARGLGGLRGCGGCFCEF